MPDLSLNNGIVESFTHFSFWPVLWSDLHEAGRGKMQSGRDHVKAYCRSKSLTALLNFEKLTAEECLRLSLCDAIV